MFSGGAYLALSVDVYGALGRSVGLPQADKSIVKKYALINIKHTACYRNVGNLSSGYTLHNFKQKTLIQLCCKKHRFQDTRCYND